VKREQFHCSLFNRFVVKNNPLRDTIGSIKILASNHQNVNLLISFFPLPSSLFTHLPHYLLPLNPIKGENGCMMRTVFYPNPVSTSIVLKWDGKIRRVYNFYTLELTDITHGVTFPVIFFQ